MKLNYDLDSSDIEETRDRGLSIIQCGCQHCGGGHACGPMFQPKYSMTFVLKGKGIYNVSGVRHEIKKGQGFVIPPDVTVSYRADDLDPWHYIYVILDGVDVEPLLRNIGISANRFVFDFEDSDETREILMKMRESGRSCKACGYELLGYFYLAVSRVTPAEKTSVETPDEYVERAVAYIVTHYPYHISLDDIAGYVNISRAYLHRLFIRRFGVSPMRWLTAYRLKKAVALMERSDLTLSEIALSSGFYDLSHFSRIYSNEFGRSPGESRNTRTGGNA